MELTEIVEIARSLSVLVRIQGPDPKSLKMRKHAFSLHESGKTTLSTSGLLLAPDSFCASPFVKLVQQYSSVSWSALVLTVASVVEPFLPVECREDPVTQVFPKLITGTQIDVMAESKKASDNIDGLGGRTPQWLPAQVLALVDNSASSLAVQLLLGGEGSCPKYGAWDVGWSLAPSSGSIQSMTGGLQTKVREDIKSALESRTFSAIDEFSSPNRVALSATRIALLGVSMKNSKDLSHINVAPQSKNGDLLLAMGSPFGVLSPLHFLNSVFVGAVSNCCPRDSSCSSLLMADLRCLPGMEGGPVFGDNACLVGILTRPLRQRVGGAEIQLVITWGAIATAISDQLLKEADKTMGIQRLCSEKTLPLGNDDSQGSKDDVCKLSRSLCSQSPYAKVLPSVVLVTVGDGAWASGIILNRHGLILTNAHLLEPWRFSKTHLLYQTTETVLPTLSIRFGKSETTDEIDGQKLEVSNASGGEEHTAFTLFKRIRVGLDHLQPRTWCDARVVYISKGTMDIALLQVESVSDQLCPIVPHFGFPFPGSKVHVIGHGLIGPQPGLLPSISSGVVAKVVEMQGPLCESGPMRTIEHRFPIMIETTATVHPGVSGGAVVNSHGLMIGLVTSNARHSGGTVVPHLNFSIPSAALKPVFEFSKDMQDLSILKALEEQNDFLSSVWTLKQPPSSTAKPFLPESLLEKNNEGKGTRFARFLAEKQAEISQDSFPSKNKYMKSSKLSNLKSKL